MTIDEYHEAMDRIPPGPWGPRGGLGIYRIHVPGGALRHPLPGRRAPARGPVEAPIRASRPAAGISEDALRFRLALLDHRFPSRP